jgi:hypothetical protein
MDTDLAGISIPKYPDQFTIDPDELRPGSDLNNYRFGTQRNRPDNASAYGRFDHGPVQYHTPGPPVETNTTLRTTRTRHQTNQTSESRASLNILADTALASPPTSVPQSRHAYSSGLSSNFAASPEKSLNSDDQKSTESTRLSHLLKAFMKELGTATNDQKVSLFRAIHESSEESTNKHQSDDNEHFVSPRTARNPSYENRINVYDSGPDGKSDSASEQEELRKGIMLIMNGLKDTRSLRDRRKAKSPPGYNACSWKNCDKVFSQGCQLRSVIGCQD